MAALATRALDLTEKDLDNSTESEVPETLDQAIRSRFQLMIAE